MEKKIEPLMFGSCNKAALLVNVHKIILISEIITH